MTRVRATLAPATAAIVLLAATACAPEPTFREPVTLGGVPVAANVLEQGKRVYTHYCVNCHGDDGAGNGRSARGLWPPPRNFTRGVFKFGGVSEPALPSDDALARIVRHGLNGTAMLPWDLSDGELAAVIQYIKTFSLPARPGDGGVELPPVGYRDPARAPAEPSIPDDPWGADTAGAVARGAEYYHANGCQLCHPAYVSPEQQLEWNGMPRVVNDQGIGPWDPVPKPSETYGAVVVPPDFLRHRVRSARELRDRDGQLRYEARDFYRILAAGIPGTAMAGWGETAQPRDLWALSHYVADLASKRDTDAGRALRAELTAIEPWDPGNFDYGYDDEGAEGEDAGGDEAGADEP